MSGGGDAPGPSPGTIALQNEQAALLREQREILSEQRRLEELLRPQLFAQLGFDPIRDASGKIIGFEQSERGKLRADIEQKFLERTQKALRGELDISPTLERELSERGTRQEESLRRQFGPGFESTTPAGEAITRREQSDIEIREGARRGELTLNEQLSLARGGQNIQAGSVARQTTLPAGFGAFQNLTGQFGSAISSGISQQQIQAQFGNNLSTLDQILIAGAGGAAAFGLSAAFCWVAEELYGRYDPRPSMIRVYLIHRGGLLARLYRRYGQKWAAYVRRYPYIRRLARAIFDRILVKARG